MPEWRCDGVTIILDQLDRSYGIDKTSQLKKTSALFVDYKWAKIFFLDQFNAGFHIPLDRVSLLEIEAKWKGHTTSQQACHFIQYQIMVIRSESGNYDITCVAFAAHYAFRGSTSYAVALATVAHNLSCQCKFRYETQKTS